MRPKKSLFDAVLTHFLMGVMLVMTYALMFGIGATLTGLVLTLEDES